MFININEIKNGMTIIMDGNLCLIQDFQHVKPGKGPAFVRMKLKNLKTGSIVEDTYNTNIKVEKAHVDKANMQFLYQEGNNYVFMDNNTYEQLEVNETILGDVKKYLKEGLEIGIETYNGEIINVNLPEKIEYVVTSTDNAVKGNTTNNAQKDATLENGLVVKVPMFISNDERIIVTTKDGKYGGRA